MIYLELSATCVRALLTNEEVGNNLIQIVLRYPSSVTSKDGQIDIMKLQSVVSKLLVDCKNYGIGCKDVVLVISDVHASLFKFKDPMQINVTANAKLAVDRIVNYIPTCSIEGIESFDHVFSNSASLSLASGTLSGFAMGTKVSSVMSLVKGLNDLGLKVVETRSSAFGLWRYVNCSIDPNVQNYVVLDLGSSFTRGLLIISGEPTHYFTLPIGSSHVTRDLAYATNLSFDQCERLKCELGLSRRTSLIRNNNQDSELFAKPWIEPRIIEILRLSLRTVAPYLPSLDGGIILGGGGARVSGLLPLAKTNFSNIDFSISRASSLDFERILGAELICDLSDDMIHGFEGLIGSVVNRRLSKQLERRLRSGIVADGKGLLSSISRWYNILTSTD